MRSQSLCAAVVLGARRTRPEPARPQHRAGSTCRDLPPVVLAFLLTSLHREASAGLSEPQPLSVAGGGGRGTDGRPLLLWKVCPASGCGRRSRAARDHLALRAAPTSLRPHDWALGASVLFAGARDAA